MNIFTKLTVLGFSTLLLSVTSFAAGGSGGHSLGFGLGLATPGQDDLDNYAETQASGKMGSAMEFEAHYQYRFSGEMFAIQFRPSYMTQSSSGTSKASITGITLFPMLRMYPLENNFIHFFMQVGLGYGKITGKIEQPGASVDFSGGAFGAVAGLGAEFCFTDSQCAFLEGNFRYLPVERSIVSSSTGTLAGNTQSGNGQELEYSGNDLKTTLSGIVGTIGYQFNF